MQHFSAVMQNHTSLVPDIPFRLLHAWVRSVWVNPGRKSGSSKGKRSTSLLEYGFVKQQENKGSSMVMVYLVKQLEMYNCQHNSVDQLTTGMVTV